MNKKYLSRYFKKVAPLLIFLFCLDISFALKISEIFYDPSGSDTDREWIEIFNDTGSSLDLTIYKFFENNVNHGIEEITDKNISSGEYIVLVQDVNKFKTDFPNYSGKIFKSSFSLSNSGEILSLKDKNGQVIYSIDYTSLSGNSGNGFGLGLDSGTGNFVKNSPTPGSGNLSIDPNAPTGDSGQNNSTTTTATSTSVNTNTDANGNFVAPIYYHKSYWPESEKVYIDIGENKIGLAGADLSFSASVLMGDKRPVLNANYFWSFGDGESAEGKNVFHNYKFTGEYTVDLEVYANGYKNNSRIYVKVIDPEISIKLKEIKGEKVVEITNKSKDEIDIGNFLIKSSGGEFEYTSNLPKRLSILPNKSVNITQATLKFATSTKNLSLNFPDGKKVADFLPVLKNETKAEFSSTIKIATGSILSVMTKSDFDRVATTSFKKTIKNVSIKYPKNPNTPNPQILATVDKVNTPKDIVEENPNIFIIKNENTIFDNFWKYFK